MIEAGVVFGTEVFRHVPKDRGSLHVHTLINWDLVREKVFYGYSPCLKCMYVHAMIQQVR